MERKFQCPSCGAGNTVTNPGVLMKVCDYCKTAIYWDEESALRVGNKSMDLPPSSRFRVGAGGKLKGRVFTVLGRLTYEHEKGTWNEWFIELSDGSIQWLSEDEGELFLETPLKLTSPVPPFDELEPGTQITLNDRLGVVEELGEARCLGGEGQIPFVVQIGETYPYADGTGLDGSFGFGLEYDTATGEPTAFVGTVLSIGATKASPAAAEPAAARYGEIIRCPSCGKPYEGRRIETTEMVVCDACGAGLELDEAKAKVVGRNVGRRPPFSFSVGTPLTFDKVTYEVMGRLSYVEVDEGREYPSYEYVLYNSDAGYLWLSEENGHFTVSRPFHQQLNIGTIAAKRKVVVGGEVFQIYEGGTVTLRWVDGAVPWVAAVGEQTHYVHLIKPPAYVDREVTGKEVELFRGRYVPRMEMAAAAPKGTTLPTARGVYSCQPYEPSEWVKGMAAIGIAFLVLNLLLLMYSYKVENPKTVLQETVSWEEYTKEHLSPPFQVDQANTIFRLDGSAPVNNSWIAADFGLVDAEERVTKEFFGDSSYYHGTDSEGSWSEGAHSFSANFRVEKPGSYSLLVHGTGGSGERGPARKEPLAVRLTSGVTLSYYFIWPILFSGVVALMGTVARMIFETRRWKPVMEDDEE